MVNTASSSPDRFKSRAGFALIKDLAFERASLLFGVLVVILIGWIGIRLFLNSSLTRGRFGLSFLTHSVWDVPHQTYGALPFIYGTLVSSALAILIALPLGVGSALFLSEVAKRKFATPISFVIELLAAIPSIIFGLWGFLVLCPFLNTHVSPWLKDTFGSNPLFGGAPVLTNMLAAGVILAIMILPVITTISREVLRAVPAGQREASLALGATKWETIWRVVLPEAKVGITGAVILGLGRALGETMAVVMVIGNTPKIAASILQPGYTMPALLANQFNEAYNDDLQRSALLEIALILFVITVIVNGFARLLVLVTTKQVKGAATKESKMAAALRFAGERGGPILFGLFIVGIVLLQFGSDLSANGIKGLFRPFELLTLASIAAYFGFGRIKNFFNNGPWRKFVNVTWQGLLSLSALTACFVLGALLLYVCSHGLKGLNIPLFTELPRPPGMEGGGMKNAIVGTLILIAIASAVGIPVGLFGGVYVALFGKGRISGGIRFAADVLNGIPSVVIGLFAYAAFVLPARHFSAWAGGLALAIMMIPIILRTTDEMLRLVPKAYLEGALALGARRSQAIRSVVLPAARSGIVTGIMLAIARIAGETAPLLFTAFGSDQLVTNPSQPISSLTMKIYLYAISPYDSWVDQAWAAALVLLIMTLLFNVTARVASRNRFAAK
ncbi:MAG: phosphate ABC transporter permease subunit PstC [Armatimonadetes bacterium]|nr:phosphate ABC transporter permease subunit PstC [Armatimonadota bacterium]